MNQRSFHTDDPAVLAEHMGDEAPVLGGSGRRAPDRRRVSIRWLAGSVLTGVTSALLMGGALHAALDGRQQLAQPANALLNFAGRNGDAQPVDRGDRAVTIVALQPVAERILQVPTMTKTSGGNVIRKRPFAYAAAPLAAVPSQKVTYAAFDPLAVFRASGDDNRAVASSDVIYGADVESDVLVNTTDFPVQSASFDTTTAISALEAERIVRNARPQLDDGAVQIAALPYLDPGRFQLDDPAVPITALDIKITAENVSDIESVEELAEDETVYDEEVVLVPPNQTLQEALAAMELDPVLLEGLTAALISDLGQGPLPSGTKLRVAWERTGPSGAKIAHRIGVYRTGTHIKSVALNDQNRVVWANEPATIPATDDDSKNLQITQVASKNLPNIYDGIYRAALSQGLSKDHARRIVRIVAFDVDFRNRIGPKDRLEVFYSLDEGETEATDSSEILYVGLTLSGVKRDYYRFRTGEEGTVDYYGPQGRSAKKFLLRKPVPNGKFRSPFGMRRHPISRVYKLHAGVDFSAPRGTPIIAAGNGVVEKAGWAGGYGRQVIIRHANGYKTSYNHMHRVTRGIKPGARVTQGQIIGQVGSTGYSTGPHLHYEVIVNGRKVNAMKIRLPNGKTLAGEELQEFQRERDRINALLDRGRGTTAQTVASL